MAKAVRIVQRRVLNAIKQRGFFNANSRKGYSDLYPCSKLSATMLCSSVPKAKENISREAVDFGLVKKSGMYWPAKHSVGREWPMFESAGKFFRGFTIANLEVGGAHVAYTFASQDSVRRSRIDIEIASLTFPDLLRGQLRPDR